LPAKSTKTPARGATSFRYEPVAGWARIPHGVTFHGDATSVAVAPDNRVYVFNRGPRPVVVFDPDGNFLTAWGEGEFDRPHGIEIDPEGNLYLVDDGGHFVQKRTAEGKVVFTLGKRGNPAPWQGGGMFNRPTDVAVNPANGDLFVSDGYGNSRVHKFDRKGKHLKSWGEPGSDPGQFSLPHNICMIGTDRVAVADRENFRVQIFTTEGKFVSQFHVHHPMSITSVNGRNGRGTTLYVGEMGPPPVQAGVPNLGNKVAIFDVDGKLLGRFGAPLPGQGADQLIAPHGISVNSKGDVFIGEVSWTFWASRLPKPPLGEVVSLRKWRRVP
jgi:sugar lactone lactonase YvrE